MGRGGPNLGMVEAKAKGGGTLVDGQQVMVRAAGGGGEGKRRGMGMPPPLAGIRRGGQRRQRMPRSSSR